MPKITFIEPNGTEKAVDAPLGDRLLDVAQRNGFEMEGACEGAMACSTCHVIVAADWYGRLDSASEDEEDMLDFAAGLTATSRLACQIEITPELDGLVVSLPKETQNMLLG
jgi:2Fe-2S ferredoxin